VAETDDEIPKINPSEVEILINKIEQSNLDERDKRLITRLLRKLLYLVSMLQEKKVTLLRLKAMIFGKKSEKRKSDEDEKEEPKGASESGGPGREKGEDVKTPRNEQREEPESEEFERRPGHGRHSTAAYPGARKVKCRHRELRSGSPCPCRNCRGKVYPVKRPHRFIQFTGNPAIGATQYEQEVVRCGDCGREYEAPLPEGVSPKKYDETADAAIAINRHGMWTPFYRTARMQEMYGVPLPESVQAERCQKVAEALEPLYERMKQEAANGKVFYGDDTPVKIMELIKENQERKKQKAKAEEKEPGSERKKKKKEEERVAIQTSGVVVKLHSGAKVALYFNGRQHAGENLETLYQRRDPQCGLPMQMSDALACNWCGERERIVCKCLAHARRKFVEIQASYPEACDYVLKQIGKVYRNERATEGLNDEERLGYHQRHSGPEMTELRQWMDGQMTEKKVEPNSSLGQAIDYFRDHYEGLTAYLRFPGAPIDNNLGEQVLRPVAIIRKNSYGYKTSRGAKAAAIIQSVIQTCRLNQINIWTYLVSVLRRFAEVRVSPEAFVPWNYKGEETTAETDSLAA